MSLLDLSPSVLRPLAPRLLVGVLLSCVVPLSSFAQSVPAEESLPATLTMEEALQRFRRRGFDLLISDATVMSAQGDLDVAGAVPNPTASGSVGKTVICPQGESCSFPNGPVFAIGISDGNAIEDSLSGKRGLRQDVARAALAAARLSRQDAERTLASQVKQQFVQVQIVSETLKLVRRTQEASLAFFKLTENRYRLGAISEADLARVETAKLESDQVVDTAIQNFRQAKVGLAFLLGVRHAVPDFEVRGEEFSRFSLPPRLAQSTPESLLQQAFELRPDLKALHQQVARAENSVALARRQRFPDIGVSAGYTLQGTTTSSITPPTVTVGLSGTLPIFYQQQGEIRKAEADLRSQQIQEMKVRAQVVSDIETAFAVFQGTKSLVNRMESGLLQRSKRALDLVSIQYQKGAASLLDYLDAQRTYNAVVLEYEQDLNNYWNSVFQLEQAAALESL